MFALYLSTIRAKFHQNQFIYVDFRILPYIQKIGGVVKIYTNVGKFGPDRFVYCKVINQKACGLTHTFHPVWLNRISPIFYTVNPRKKCFSVLNYKLYQVKIVFPQHICTNSPANILLSYATSTAAANINNNFTAAYYPYIYLSHFK